MSKSAKKWYKSWFNSPYYHILYANRDFKEAEDFIDRIYEHLKPAQGARALDAGCGRGRHSIHLNQQGLDVTGIDLSPENIHYASQSANDTLHFYVHDMRNLLYSNYFDYVFNLFTSFGYFRSERENLKAIQMFSKSLKPKGKLILDFINTGILHNQLEQEELKIVDGIEFHIQRKIENKTLLKEIRFQDCGESHRYREEVKALRLEDFKKYFKLKNLSILELFGDYMLNPYNPEQSERLIIIAEKNA